MRSKTIQVSPKGRLHVRKMRDGHVGIGADGQYTGRSVGVWPTTKQARKIFQAGLQMCDEIDAAKAKEASDANAN